MAPAILVVVILAAALVGYFAGNIRTQSQFKPVTQRLQETEQSLQIQLALTQLCHDMVLNWHVRDGQLTVQNRIDSPLALNLSGSIVHINDWYDMVHPDDIIALKHKMQSLIKSSNLHCSSQYRVLLDNGHYAQVIEYCVVHRNEHNEALQMLRAIKDISVQKQQLTSLERKCQQRKVKALITVVDGVAHDHNNVLAVISGFTELLELKLDENSDLKYYVEQLMQACDKGKLSGNKLLAYSRRRRTNQVEVAFDQAVMALMADLQTQLPDSITIETALRSDGAKVLLDNDQLDIALGHLLANSAQAMSQNGVIWLTSQIVTLSVDAAQSLQLDAGQWLVFALKDDGCGMDDTAVSQMFDPYYSNTGSTGLGLSQVYGFVQCCQGGIEVSSKPDKGCKILIYLPLR